MKGLAELCTYTNAHLCTSHGKRKFGTTQLVNDNAIGPEQTINLTRHSHYSTVGIYEKPSQKSIDRAISTLNGFNQGDSQVPFDYGPQEMEVDDDRKVPAKSIPSPLQDVTNTGFSTTLTLYNQSNTDSTFDSANQDKPRTPFAVAGGGSHDFTDVFNDLATENENSFPAGGRLLNANVIPRSTGQVYLPNKKKITFEDPSLLPRPRSLSFQEQPSPMVPDPLQQQDG